MAKPQDSLKTLAAAVSCALLVATIGCGSSGGAPKKSNSAGAQTGNSGDQVQQQVQTPAATTPDVSTPVSNLPGNSTTDIPTDPPNSDLNTGATDIAGMMQLIQKIIASSSGGDMSALLGQGGDLTKLISMISQQAGGLGGLGNLGGGLGGLGDLTKLLSGLSAGASGQDLSGILGGGDPSQLLSALQSAGGLQALLASLEQLKGLTLHDGVEP